MRNSGQILVHGSEPISDGNFSVETPESYYKRLALQTEKTSRKTVLGKLVIFCSFGVSWWWTKLKRDQTSNTKLTWIHCLYRGCLISLCQIDPIETHSRRPILVGREVYRWDWYDWDAPICVSLGQCIPAITVPTVDLTSHSYRSQADRLGAVILDTPYREIQSFQVWTLSVHTVQDHLQNLIITICKRNEKTKSNQRINTTWI